MKIEIISMQRVINLGSFLQAYGLKSLLEQFADDVRYADIRPGINNDEFCQFFKKEQSDVTKLQHYKVRIYDKIQEYILKREQRDVLNIDYHFDDDEQVDSAFIGSDEMFNCLAPSPWGVSEQLFGRVDHADKVFSYAVSCGHTTFDAIPESVIPYIKSAMENFSCISVRDNNTAQFVEALMGKKPLFNLDPVLMYSFDNEIRLPKIKKPYLLIYAYSNRINNKKEIAAIKKFAKSKGLLTVGVGVFQYWCDRNIPATPFETLGYFHNADYVITDTFHGAVLSIKYNREFAVFTRKSNYHKLYDLLERLEQTSRCIKDIADFEKVVNKKVDYTETNKIIAAEQAKTQKYLQECVKSLEGK